MDRVNELIRQEINSIIAKEVEFPSDYLVTIIRVQTTTDLKVARVFLSILPTHFRGSAVEILKKHLPLIQQRLRERLVMRCTPKVCFRIDTSEERADHINRLLDSLGGPS